MRTIEVTLDGTTYEIEVRPDPADHTRFVAVVDGVALPVYVPQQAAFAPTSPSHLEWMVIDGRPYELVVGDQMEWLLSSGGKHELDVRLKGSAAHARPSTNDGRVKAPIPGLIRRVLVEEGGAVESGAALLVLEAMKMENEIRAPRSGTVRSVSVEVGQTVVLGELMMEIG